MNLKLKRKKLMCDPPEGWKYGFPKEYNPEAVNVTQRQWFIDNGYPEKVMEQYKEHFHVRYWYEEEDYNNNEYT